VLAKYDQFSSIYDVCVGEALSLLSALKWVHRLNLGRVELELDSKLVAVFSILTRLNLERSLHIVEDFSHIWMLTLVLSSFRRQSNKVAYS
jgi:ribonuclease HI